MNILHETLRPAHAARLERWLGATEVERLQAIMRGWYGSPIHLLDTPGSVRVRSDGDFVGKFGVSRFSIGLDWQTYKSIQQRQMMAGFASISDALSRASQGYKQSAAFAKVGPTGVVGFSSSLWRVGPQPAVGASPATAPAGTAFDRTSTGALKWDNPAAGTSHLTGADVGAGVINNTLLLYDLLFGVAKTINSTAIESVTGVPTRYQSSTPANPDYAGSNFLFIQAGGTALAATAHNWTVCLYRNQAGADAQTMPSLAGSTIACIVDRFDHPISQWFAPLAAGDSGIMDLNQMQCSALVATGVAWFMIGHPIGFMSFPVINSLLPFDWLTNRDQAPRIFDNACLAFIEPLKPAATATTYTGIIYATGAAA
jgi:hypothetical protein